MFYECSAAASCQLQGASCELQAASCELQAANCQLVLIISNFEFPVQTPPPTRITQETPRARLGQAGGKGAWLNAVPGYTPPPINKWVTFKKADIRGAYKSG